MTATREDRVLRLKGSLVYGTKLIVGLTLVWTVLPLWGDLSPMWAGISLVVVSLEPTSTGAASVARILHTVIGAAAGIAALTLLGASLWSMCLAVVVVVVVCAQVFGLPTTWKIAPVTTVIVMAESLRLHSAESGVQTSWRRLIEVTIGSLLAVALSELTVLLVGSRVARSRAHGTSTS